MPSNQNSIAALEEFKHGIKSVDDYQKYLALLQNTSEYKSNQFEPLFKTLDSVVLSSIGESQEFGKVMKQLADVACNSWNEDMIKSLLKIMDHIPLHLDVLIKNSLGFCVKNIKKNAIENNNTEIIELTNALIEKWKVLQKKSGLNANGKRNSPDRSSSTSPPSSIESPVKKQIKLEIQKEPPTRPKAMADLNFLSSLRDSKKYPNTRPIYNVDKILEGFGNKLVKSSTLLDNDSILSHMKREAANNSTSDAADSPKRKRVRFKDDLFEIREYEKNPEEWTSFDANGKSVEHQYGNARDLDVKEGQNAFMHVPQIAWYTPLELRFDLDSANSSLNVRSLTQSNEALAQDDREKLALAAIYTSPQHIPPSPAEPDEIPKFDSDDSVPVIPLDDTESLPVSTPMTTISSSSPPPPPPPPSHLSSSAVPTVQSNLITAANLNAAAAAIAAMKEQSSFMIPQQQQQQQHQQYTHPITNIAAHVPASSTANYYKQPLTTAQAPQNVVSPTTPPNIAGMFNQPAISNQTVESMLKNNPGIMNSLKQLSFLAAGNIVNGNTVPQQTQAQSQPTYQTTQSYHPYQQHPPSNKQQFQQNDWNRNNSNEYMNDTHIQQQRKKNKGRGARGRNNRGGANGRNNGRMPTVCTFYNSPDGCRNGDSCSFLHEDLH